MNVNSASAPGSASSLGRRKPQRVNITRGVRAPFQAHEAGRHVGLRRGQTQERRPALHVPLPPARRDRPPTVEQEAVLEPRRVGGHAAVGDDEQQLAVAAVDRAKQAEVSVVANEPVVVAGRAVEVDDALVRGHSRGRPRS